MEQAISGRDVAIVSSGDSGIYGMVGLVYEILQAKGWRREDPPDIEAVPGSHP